MMMNNRIFEIQRFSLHNGPGIRTTLFLQGCPLRCKWCHNPESFQPATADARLSKDASTLDTLIRLLLRDQHFYNKTGGGITISGGEPMLQTGLLTQLLPALKSKGLHITLDTSGHVPYTAFKSIEAYVDLYLYDLKHMDSVVHKKLTGVGNELILSNLAALLKDDKKLHLRLPIIQSINDSEAHLQKLLTYVNHLENHHNILQIDLLPHHSLGEHKYHSQNLPAPNYRAPSPEYMAHLKAIVNHTLGKRL